MDITSHAEDCFVLAVLLSKSTDAPAPKE